MQKVNFIDTEEITSADLNAISKLVHQLSKEMGSVLFAPNSVFAGFSYPGCLLNGLKVTLTPGLSASVSVGAGTLFLGLNPDPNSYSGTVVPVTSVTLQPTLPSSGTTTYYIDISYSEGADTTSFETRNVYSSATTNAYSATLPVYTSAVIKSSLTTTTSPAAGSTRLGTFTINSSGVFTSGFTYTLPYVWNLQKWSTFEHQDNTKNLTTSTLAQSLSEIRAEIASILGAGANWYDAPAIDIATASSQISAMYSQLTNVPSGIKQCVMLGTGSGTLSIPSTVKRVWVRCWGPGGDGAGSGSRWAGSLLPTFQAWCGGGGGAGGYCEALVNLGTHSTTSVPYTVGDHGTTVSTSLNLTSLGGPALIAYAGSNGTGLHNGSGGAGGTASGGNLNVTGQKGTSGFDRTIIAMDDYWGIRFSACTATGGFPFSCFRGFGRGGDSGIVDPGPGGATGLSGGPGIILVYFM